MTREHYAGLSLLDFVEALSPQFKSPLHMKELCDVFERIARGEVVRALCSYPIRHWKTETMLHAIVWLLCKDPSLCFVLQTFDHARAEMLGKKVRWLADRAGVGGMRGANTIRTWKNDAGGGVTVMSADQSSEGADCHILLVDDPLSEDGARDPAQREAVDECIAYYTMRCLRNGKLGSVVIVASRFHPKDPVGLRLDRHAVEWIYLHSAAVKNWTGPQDWGAPGVQAFAPNVLDLPALQSLYEEAHEKDPTDRNWWARYMGSPIVVGGSKFGTPEVYTSLPDYSYRLGYGVDLAASAGEGSDHFALVVGKYMANKLYVLEIQRTKLEPHLIESVCKSALNTYGRGNFFSYVSGPELGMVKIMRERGLPFVPMHARYSKLVRAERTIQRHNDGRIVYPAVAAWRRGWDARAEMFTGSEKATDDDEIDALVSLSDGIFGTGIGSGPKSLGRAYQGFNAP